MRLTALIVAISLTCSTSSAMWRPWTAPKPLPSENTGFVKKVEMAVMVAAGVWTLFELFISDDGFLAYLEGTPRPRRNND